MARLNKEEFGLFMTS